MAETISISSLEESIISLEESVISLEESIISLEESIISVEDSGEEMDVEVGRLLPSPSFTDQVEENGRRSTDQDYIDLTDPRRDFVLAEEMKRQNSKSDMAIDLTESDQPKKTFGKAQSSHLTPTVNVTRLPILEKLMTDLTKSQELTKDCTNISVCISDLGPVKEAKVFSSRSDTPGLLFSQHESNVKENVGLDTKVVNKENKDTVCPRMLTKLMGRSAEALIVGDEECFVAPKVLCKEHLSVVYCTLEMTSPEATLEECFALIQPGHYFPKDITSHVLKGILLKEKCSQYHRVQAFNLLMTAQINHFADKASVPWDWDLLTSVMANQHPTGPYDCEVVRMLLQYIVQTLEDDFYVKQRASILYLSIAKATLSCVWHFPQVRDVIKWLFSTIVKSTEYGESKNKTREKNEQLRMLSIFERMLSLALKVDCCPAVNSARLAQELFHRLISKNRPPRAHRMLLLESLQNNLLRNNLLEYLLQYTCSKKSSLPMSYELLLHFLNNCTLALDPNDATERLQQWEELIYLLRMLLIGYSTTTKGHQGNLLTNKRMRSPSPVVRPEHVISSLAIQDAVNSFRSRSEADLGHTLPPHVEESLTLLRDNLIDICLC